MNHHSSDDPDEHLSASDDASSERSKQQGTQQQQQQQAASELTPQQLALQQQQLQQQQLQLLQLQQQQLQAMSPSELAAMAAMAQQMLGMVMMPMMPFMMPMGQMLHAAAATTASVAASGAQTASPSGSERRDGDSPTRSDASPSVGPTPAAPEPFSDVLPHNASPLALMAPFALPPVSSDDTPKRKRGRPPKKDIVARAKADAEKTLKHFPVWGYGMPLPLLPGFAGMLGHPGALSSLGDVQPQQSSSGTLTRDDSAKGTDDDPSGFGKTSSRSGRGSKGPAKKKARGTGKPRGRPRTRPRPGEIIPRSKPAAIAPANYSVMYNYSLSALAQHQQPPQQQRSAELSTDSSTSASHDESRLAAIGATLLSGDHE